MKNLEKYAKEISQAIADGDEGCTCLAFARSRNTGNCKKCPLQNVRCCNQEEVLKWLMEEESDDQKQN